MDEDMILEFECPTCGEWFREGEGLVPHVLRDHPDSRMAHQIDDALLERMLEGG